MQRDLLLPLALLLALGSASPALAQTAASNWLERAGRAEQAGHRARALRLLRRALTRTPSDPRLALALCETLVPRDAEAAVELDPDTLHALVSEARAALSQIATVDESDGEDEVARLTLRRSLWLERAWHTALGGDLESAVRAIAERAPRVDRQAALRAREVAALAIRHGELPAASAALELARAADATLSGVALEQSAVLAARGRLAASANLLRRQLEAHPEDSTASIALARVLLADGQVDESLSLYRARLAHCPREIPCQLEWVRALLQAHRFRQARRLTLELTHGQTPAPRSFTLLGLAEVGLGHPVAAARAFRGALALDPEDAQARASLRALEPAQSAVIVPQASESAPSSTPAMLAP